MDILIIGNGFDLAHGLETSYKQFLDFVKKEHSKENSCYKDCYERNLWMKHFLNRLYNNDGNIINKGNKWIDLEKEIYTVILNLRLHPIRKPQVLSICMVDTEFNFKDMNLRDLSWNENLSRESYIEPSHPHYIMYYIKDNNAFIDLLYRHLREFTKVFEIYLKKEVLSNLDNNSEFKLSLKAAGIEEGSNDVYVLSFNYTDTCERLYKEKFNSHCCIDKIKSIYVHGKVDNSGECKLVLGTHSFENTDKTNIPVEFNVFKKHTQRHKYSTIEQYQDLIREIKYQEEQHENHPVFHIIGHSLDETDHNIIKHILLANPNSIINVYYHNEEAQERLINNITEIIGEEEVMSKVRLIHQHDDERSILKRKSN